MKTIVSILLSIIVALPCYSQQVLPLAFPDEITYRGDVAYFQGTPFTGKLIDNKTNKEIGGFREGFRYGPFKEYFANGKIKIEAFYNQGELEGKTSIWHESGKKRKEINYISGELHGKFTEWHSNGTIKVEYNYISGKINDGRYIIYLENGQKEKEESYSKGLIMSEGIYKDGKLYNLYEKSVAYFNNGKIKTEGYLKNGLKDSIWTEWFKSGDKKNEVKFKDGIITLLIYENSSYIADLDDNVYSILTLGTQRWLGENLKTTKYSDGTLILNVTDSKSWQYLSSGAYCIYGNDPSKKERYGALYNGYAINTRKLCPTGWHVPSDDEWTILRNYVGGPSVAGGRLKQTGTSNWNWPNIGATNSFGFNAIASGGRSNLGAFDFLGVVCCMWSSSSSNLLTVRNINFKSGALYIDNSDNTFGFSVRCTKD